jgi:hypothetical protein
MVYKTICRLVYLLLVCSFLQAQELRGELVLKGFQQAYPDKVGDVAFIDGDWAIWIGNEVFYWAEGRLLPASARTSWETYSSHTFSLYPYDIPRPELYAPEEIEEFRRQGSAETGLDKKDTHYGLVAALYGGMSRREVEAYQVKTTFLGRRLVIHQNIVEALERINQVIQQLAKNDPEVAAFISSIDSIGGYNWRAIQGTQRLSYHSWGLAVDIQPKKLRNKAIYWQWERIFNDNWMLVPMERRWCPPVAVIQAFEHEGFIWGGKWALYDNMHFEYRPELHRMNYLVALEADKDQQHTTYTNVLELHHLYPGDLFPSKYAPFFQRLLRFGTRR